MLLNKHTSIPMNRMEGITFFLSCKNKIHIYQKVNVKTKMMHIIQVISHNFVL